MRRLRLLTAVMVSKRLLTPARATALASMLAPCSRLDTPPPSPGSEASEAFAPAAACVRISAGKRRNCFYSTKKWVAPHRGLGAPRRLLLRGRGHRGWGVARGFP